jgi:hypothetical protein
MRARRRNHPGKSQNSDVGITRSFTSCRSEGRTLASNRLLQSCPWPQAAAGPTPATHDIQIPHSIWLDTNAPTRRKRSKKRYVRRYGRALMLVLDKMVRPERLLAAAAAAHPSLSLGTAVASLRRPTSPAAKLSNSACCPPGVRICGAEWSVSTKGSQARKVWCARRDSNSRPPGS